MLIKGGRQQASGIRQMVSRINTRMFGYAFPFEGGQGDVEFKYYLVNMTNIFDNQTFTNEDYSGRDISGFEYETFILL